MSNPRPRRRRPRAVQITERDREVLAFVADHRIVLAAHVASLLEVSVGAADARLRALSATGLLIRRPVFHQQPPCYRATCQGLAAVGSELRAPSIDVRGYAHDVGMAWVWLIARAGGFGELRGFVSERQMRSRDARPDREDEPLAMRLGGLGSGGRERLHYPDLLLDTAEGRRVGVELELTDKGRSRRERILAGYAADSRIDAVLYLTDRRGLAKGLNESIRRLGITGLARVELVSWGESMKQIAAGAAADRAQPQRRSAARARGRPVTPPAHARSPEAGR
jgi:hypothetical protein